VNSLNKIARTAGSLYLIYIVVSILADVFGTSPLIVWGDAAATAGNIMAHEWQFRVGFVGDLVAGVLFLLTAWALYALLKPVNEKLALLFLLLNQWCYLKEVMRTPKLKVTKLPAKGKPHDHSRFYHRAFLPD
jgi:hypothetical protein